jgi:predicted double-glycine peptidase
MLYGFNLYSQTSDQLVLLVIFIIMSKHTDKINAMNSAGKSLNDEWVKNKITPEKNEEEMKEKIGQIINKNRKKGFSFFR